VNYSFQFGALAPYGDLIVEGAFQTLRLSAITMAIGLAIGLVGALARTSRVAPARWAATAYVEAIRNTPLLVQLFVVFFGLPSLGVKLGAGAAALVALSVNLGAYATEIIRAGIDSVHKSQVEAGLSLGLTNLQVFRHIVLYQASKAVYPALASQFILLMLATSLASQIGADELFHGGAYVDSRTFRSFEVYAVITVVYLILALIFRALFGALYAVAFGPLSALAGSAFCGGALLGAVVLVLRVLPLALLNWLAAGYIGLLQGTPLLGQLFLFYFGLSIVGVNVSAWFAATLALSFHASAFLAEIWRGCVRPVSGIPPHSALFRPGWVSCRKPNDTSNLPFRCIPRRSSSYLHVPRPGAYRGGIGGRRCVSPRPYSTSRRPSNQARIGRSCGMTNSKVSASCICARALRASLCNIVWAAKAAASISRR
jgi:polar amino acid transport system permease protein